MLSFLWSLPERYGRPAVKGSYLASLDGLRAVAIAIVIFWHVTLRVFRLTLDGPFVLSDNAGFLQHVPHGEVGVRLFFFISGFIIMRPFLANDTAMSLRATGQFYLRRIVRIAPPHILFITLAFLALAVGGYRPERAVNFVSAHQSLRESYLASLVYLNGLLFQTPPRLNPPTWSLEIEMQFYALFPIIVAVRALDWQQIAGRFLPAFATIMAALFTVAVVGVWGPYSYIRWTVFSYFYLFLLGICVAQFEATGPRPPRLTPALYDALCLAGLGLLLCTGLFRSEHHAAAEALRISASIGAILLLFYGATRGHVAAKLLGHRWVALFGAMSYSIYLTHVAIIQAGATMLFKLVNLHNIVANMILALSVLLPIILAVGTAYYIVVERFCMRAGRHARQPAPVTGPA